MISRYRTFRPETQNEELAADSQEHTHVQQTAEHDHDARGPSDSRAEALFDQFRNRDDT